MDKNAIILMLNNIKNTNSIGALRDSYEIGERINFAINKNLITRLDTGSLRITEKGIDLLENKISWEDI
jgi:hypothetical protein